jgi:hypothetical protein
MYDIYIPVPLNFNVSIDENLVFGEHIIFLRNKTVSNDLSVNIEVPHYITLSQNSLILNKESIIKVTLSLNPVEVRKNIISKNLNNNSEISFKVSPLYVNGPVYVRTGLPSISSVV